MENIKWKILILLLFALAFIIIFNNIKKKDKPEFVNYIEFDVYYSHYESTVFLAPAKYILPLTSFQLIDGKAKGLHLEFKKIINEKEAIILIFDFADTLNYLFANNYPFFFHNTSFENLFKEKSRSFYRSYVEAGIVEKVSENKHKMVTMKMNRLACTIDTFWINNDTASLSLHLLATLDEEFKESTGKNFEIWGKINIPSTKFTIRKI